MDHHVSVRLLPDVFVGFGTFAVSDALTLQIKHDVICGVDSRRLVGGSRLAVHSDTVV